MVSSNGPNAELKYAAILPTRVVAKDPSSAFYTLSGWMMKHTGHENVTTEVDAVARDSTNLGFWRAVALKGEATDTACSQVLV